MSNKKRIVILFGGMSSEHEVSCCSAASIVRNIDTDIYDVCKVGVDKQGKWLFTEATANEIENGNWIDLDSNRNVNLLVTRTPRGLVFDDGETMDIDCVFLMTHGKYGEDGCIQGTLELSGIKFIGPGVLSSAICMDKITSKQIAKSVNVKQAKYYTTNRYQFSSNPIGEIENIEKYFDKKYPLFIKPANTGSSVGITKARNDRELFNGIIVAAEKDHKIIIEEAIVGREFEIGVLGNRKPHASCIGEVISANEFYDYSAKYTNAESRTEIVKDLSESEEEYIKDTAIELFNAFSCRGFSRVDFFFTEDRDVVFNEINTLPGFTNISMYPKLWEATGIEYKELISKLIELAMED